MVKMREEGCGQLLGEMLQVLVVATMGRLNSTGLDEVLLHAEYDHVDVGEGSGVSR